MATAVAGCEHTAPFSGTDYHATTPLEPGNPARLTYNLGVDTRASWLPDGSAFLFTEQQVGLPDRDQCLAAIPASGGSITRLICTDTDPAGDSTNVFLAPAVSADLRMAYVRTSTIANFGRTTPDHGALVLATYALPLPGKQILPLPYFSPGGQSVTFASDLHWTDRATLYFLADRFQFTCLNLSCTIGDTSIVGLEIDRVITTDPPSITLVTGTVGASALATAGSDTLYYALSGSGDLHRVILSTSTDSVIFTFSGAVTGLSVASGRLAAAVAGTLHLFVLATAADTVLAAPGLADLMDHPALDPTGHTLIADVTDTSSGLPADLWRWSIP
jgi:hypothetical protein